MKALMQVVKLGAQLIGDLNIGLSSGSLFQSVRKLLDSMMGDVVRGQSANPCALVTEKEGKEFNVQLRGRAGVKRNKRVDAFVHTPTGGQRADGRTKGGPAGAELAKHCRGVFTEWSARTSGMGEQAFGVCLVK
jgi:hypothetical protein